MSDSMIAAWGTVAETAPANGEPPEEARASRLQSTGLQSTKGADQAGSNTVCLTARSLQTSIRQYGRRKTLLDDVTLSLPRNSLIAVIGPSGAGKTTLLRALTGYQPADKGNVLYEGCDLYRHFGVLRRQIGFVPQDDILHTQLTVRTALRYAARLRFAKDHDDAARDARVEEVLSELSLTHRSDTQIASLSGGQRKRVSVALELLTKPSLLFLDEPTSGLDPGLDRQVMQMLRGLVDGGRTVVLTTHSVANLELCDRLLVLAPGGRTAYFGLPSEALEFFGKKDWADVFQEFELSPNRFWADGYRKSEHYRRHITGLTSETFGEAGSRLVRKQKSATASPSWFAQLATLVRRHFSVIAADRGYVILTVCLPLLMGLLSRAVPAPDGFLIPSQQGSDQDLYSSFNVDASRVVVMLAVGACLTGMANSIRELVQERMIYQRERATGLSRSAYATSKIIVLGLVTALQGLSIGVLGLIGRRLPETGLVFPSALLEMTLIIGLLSVTSMVIGLVISALVRTAEKTMPLLTMATLFQIMATSAVFPMFNQVGLAQLSWLAPSRWAVGALAATVDLSRVSPPAEAKNPKMRDTLWRHDLAQWITDIGILAAIGLIGFFLVIKFLRRHEPAVMRKH